MKYYKLMYPEYVEPPEKPNLINIDDKIVGSVLSMLDQKEFAYDWETNGLKVWTGVFWNRCVSFHNDDVSIAIQIREENGGLIDGRREKELYNWLTKQPYLIAHNAYFEHSVLFRATNKLVKPWCCTKIACKELANEGWKNQNWSLDELISRLLLWDESPIPFKPLYVYNFHKHLKNKGLPKDKMCHADWNQIGWYNQLDSAGTWALYNRCKDVVAQHTDNWGEYYWDYHREDVMNWLEMELEAYKEGLTLNMNELQEYDARLKQDLIDAREEFVQHPKIKPIIDKLNADALTEHMARKPVIKMTRDGLPNQLNIKSLKKWERELLELQEGGAFNMNSGKQLKALFTQVFKVVDVGDKFEVYER